MTLAQQIGARIREVRSGMTQVRFAEMIGISVNTLRGYETGKRMLPADTMLRIAEETGGTADWLLTGISFKNLPAAAQPPVEGAQSREHSILPRPPMWTVPLVALAGCGIDSWYDAELLSIRIPVPPYIPYTPELVAVIARGNSMIPDGIREGFIVFCNPLKPPAKNDAVYIVRNNGSATIKKFLECSSGILRIQGWLDPDKNGQQKPYSEEVLESEIKSIAPVVMVIRDLWGG